jgi:hypothetical protein
MENNFGPSSSRPNERQLEMRGVRITPRHNLDLPYGVWQRPDGSEVLFDRNYVPILQRDADGGNVRPCPPVWVEREKQQWFWGSGSTGFPIAKKAKTGSWARTHGEAILAAFKTGEPVDPLVLDPAP